MGSSKKNIITGLLCCLLMIMGVGYAVLGQKLVINATGSISGKWDIYIESINHNETDTKGTAKHITSKVNTKTTASFEAHLNAPGDKIVYDVKVVNGGNIDAVLSKVLVNLTADDELDEYLRKNNKKIEDYFTVEHTLIPNMALNSGEDTTFKVSVEFNENVADIPNGSLNVNITILYLQQGVKNSNDVTQEDDLDYILDANGTVIGFNKAKVEINDDGYLVVPAFNSKGEEIKSISAGSFASKKNAAIVVDGEDEPSDIIIYDEENFDKIKSIFQQNGLTGYSFYKVSDYDITVLSDNMTYNAIYVDLASNQVGFATSDITSLDLSQATNLDRIRPLAFANSSLKNIILGDNIISIGDSAFYQVNLNGEIKLPSNLKSIGVDAFRSSNITGELVIPSTVEFIDSSAFYGNDITTITIEEGTRLDKISWWWFASNNNLTVLNTNMSQAEFESKAVGWENASIQINYK